MSDHRYILIHEHDHGISTHHFITPAPLTMLDDDRVAVLAKFLGIDYEPHKGESLTLEDYTEVFQTLTPEQFKEIMDS